MSVRMETFNSREEWLGARAGRIGGSDASAIIGMNPYRSNVELWKTKTGQMEPEDISDKPYVRYGTEAESHLRALFALDYPQFKVDYVENNMFLNDKYPFAHASLDGWLTDEDGRRGILEIKTTSAYNNDAWEIGPLPYYYICQATWYTMITGLPAFDIVCLVGGQKLYSYHVPKDPELCERMTKAAEEFWNVNVKELKEPKATAVDIARMQAEEVSTAPDEEPLIDNSDETNNIVVAYIELRDKISALEKIKKQLSASIWQCLHKKPAMLTQANTVTVSQTVRRKCDLDALQRDFPEAYEATVTQSTEQRLNVK